MPYAVPLLFYIGLKTSWMPKPQGIRANVFNKREKVVIINLV
jgi:hypothetical protein